MRALITFLILIVSLSIGIDAKAAGVPLTVYLQDTSEELDQVKETEAKLFEALRELIQNRELSLRIINVVNEKYTKLYEDHLAEVEQADINGVFPLVVYGDGDTSFVKAGTDAVDSAISLITAFTIIGDRFMDVESGDSVIVYFYKENCPYCEQIRPLMEAIPKKITLPDGTLNRVRVIWLNKNEQSDYGIIENYYRLLSIPSSRQYVPMVLIGDSTLYLYDEIVPNLLAYLLNGEGLSTPLDPFQ